jgi:CspA family cold shock protein
VLDQTENRDSTENGGLKPRQRDATVSPRQPRPLTPIDSGEPRRPSRGKGPIINQKGPSEVGNAIKMARAKSARPSATGRKVAEGTLGRGTVVRIDRAKGFGFLVDAVGEQRFFHRSAVLDAGFTNLKEQQSVDFEAHTDERGARALKIRPATSATTPSRSPQRTPASPKTARPTAWKSDLSPFRNGSGSPTAGRKGY